DHVIKFNPLIPESERIRLSKLSESKSKSESISKLRKAVLESDTMISEFSLFREGKKTLIVPVYTVCGSCEDVAVLEKFRSGEYKVRNLNILDEENTYVFDIGGVSLRLIGLGGIIMYNKLFD